MRGKLCYKMEFEDGSVSFSEAFDPEYDIDTHAHLGDRPPTSTQQRDKRCKRKVSRKKSK